MPDAEEGEDQRTSSDDWISSAVVLQLALKRLADPGKARNLLTAACRSGRLTVSCDVFVEGWDVGQLPEDPPSRTSPSITAIRRSSGAKRIMLGRAFWNSHTSRFHSELTNWEAGIFISVDNPVPAMMRFMGNRPTIPAQKKLIAYGVKVRRQEALDFVAKLPNASLNVIAGVERKPELLPAWDWDEATAHVKAWLPSLSEKDTRWFKRRGALAKLEDIMARYFCARSDDQPHETTIRRHCAPILENIRDTAEAAEPS